MSRRPKPKAKRKPRAARPARTSPIERWIGPAARDADGKPASGDPPPFWETKGLEEMSAAEWESLCDGCGQCCLVKVEDEDTGDIYLTRLACRLLDVGTCRCKDYANRFERMSDCLDINLKSVRELSWLPESCAYRRIAEGRGLAWWHPLVSGDPETVHQAGVSVRGWAIGEHRARSPHIAHYIIGEVD